VWTEICMKLRTLGSLAPRLTLLRVASAMSSLAFPQHSASGGNLLRPGAAQQVQPGPGQQSVWDPPFTRPPSIRDVSGRLVQIRIGEEGPVILESTSAVQVCETSHPPTWYFPKADVQMGHLRRLGGNTFCEFKGTASYYDIMSSPTGANSKESPLLPQGAWTYDRTETSEIEGRLAFYLRPPLVAYVDGKRATPQQGDFYGGWITDDVVGPFKGGPGSRYW